MEDAKVLQRISILKDLITRVYVEKGNVILLKQPYEKDFDIMDCYDDFILSALKKRVLNLMTITLNEKSSDLDIPYLEKFLNVNFHSFILFCKRILTLRSLALKYPGKYDDTLNGLINNIVFQIVSRYIDGIIDYLKTGNLSYFIKMEGPNLANE